MTSKTRPDDDYRNANTHYQDTYRRSTDDVALLPGEKPKTYAVRWYVLFLFCMASVLQGLSWSSLGPIAHTCQAVFGWSDGNIAGTVLAGTLLFIFCCFPFSWLMENKGMRWSLLISVFLMTSGFCIRCITMYPPGVTWCMTIGQGLVGAGAVVPVSASPMISSLWFPMNQRTTATSIATIFGLVGAAVGFVVGPMVVPEFHGVNSTSTNHSHTNNSNYSIHDLFDPIPKENSSLIEEQRDAIGKLMYGEAGFAVLVFILILIYFPAKPKTPPSFTANQRRLNIISGVKSLVKNKSFLLVLIASAVGPGVYNSFTAVMDIVMKPLNISQETAGWMGFYSTVGGCAAGFVFSWLSDMFRRRHKFFLVFFFLPSSILVFWFWLLVTKFIPYNKASLYIATIMPGVLIQGAMPLFFEIACEASYPTGEGITALTMTLTNTVIAVIFFGVLAIKNIGVIWMTYLLVAATIFTLVVVIITPVRYNRTNLDVQQTDGPLVPESSKAVTVGGNVNDGPF